MNRKTVTVCMLITSITSATSYGQATSTAGVYSPDNGGVNSQTQTIVTQPTTINPSVSAGSTAVTAGSPMVNPSTVVNQPIGNVPAISINSPQTSFSNPIQTTTPTVPTRGTVIDQGGNLKMLAPPAPINPVPGQPNALPQTPIGGPALTGSPVQTQNQGGDLGGKVPNMTPAGNQPFVPALQQGNMQNNPNVGNYQGIPQTGGVINQGIPQTSGVINQGIPQTGGIVNQGVPQTNAVNQGVPQTGSGISQPLPRNGTFINQGVPQANTVVNQGIPQTGGVVNQGIPQTGNVINQGIPSQSVVNQGVPRSGPVVNQGVPTGGSPMIGAPTIPGTSPPTSNLNQPSIMPNRPTGIQNPSTNGQGIPPTQILNNSNQSRAGSPAMNNQPNAVAPAQNTQAGRPTSSTTTAAPAR
ncbi:MAG: hypothetical protein H0W64_03025 [Gammaproteobacteria bacterium]|nr:hypothetical protein [Gammaproteobacteria bacterium]